MTELLGKRPSMVRYLLLGALAAGTLDLVYAFTLWWMRGVSPVRILQAISSGLQGADAYRGGATSATLGAVLHYLILMVAAALFYAASRRFDWLWQHAVISGMAFGLGIYVVMNHIVVPLSAFPGRSAVEPLLVFTGVLAHLFLVGVPIALSIRAGWRAGAGR